MIADLDAMPYDAELIKRVLDEKQVSVEALARRSGFDDKTLYRYFSGERTLPSAVIRAAFELSHDGRLLGLISGDVPVAILCPHCVTAANRGVRTSGSPSGSEQIVRIPPLNQALATTLEAIERAASSGRYMHKIAEDGKFTPGDLEASEKFERDALTAQECLAISVAAIRHYRKAVTA